MTKYGKRFDRMLLEEMEKGKLNCQIYAKWNISEQTFYRWLKENISFRESYEIGKPKAEAIWLEKAEQYMASGNSKAFNYWISVMNNKFEWAKNMRESQALSNTQININNVNMFKEQSLEQLKEFIEDSIIDIPILDMTPRLPSNGSNE